MAQSRRPKRGVLDRGAGRDGVLKRLAVMLEITRSHGIVRRYFVVNGFDGALTMLGLITGFHASADVALPVVTSVCVGAAIALGVSGLSSAYISEAAEKRHELRRLEQAMVTDLEHSTHGDAARFMPFVIALANGMAPLLIALPIIAALHAPAFVPGLPLTSLEAALATALLILFLLGVFLGRISGTFWLWSGLRTLLLAAVTAAIIGVLVPA